MVDGANEIAMKTSRSVRAHDRFDEIINPKAQLAQSENNDQSTTKQTRLDSGLSAEPKESAADLDLEPVYRVLIRAYVREMGEGKGTKTD
jgi:hypothetical protein